MLREVDTRKRSPFLTGRIRTPELDSSVGFLFRKHRAQVLPASRFMGSFARQAIMGILPQLLPVNLPRIRDMYLEFRGLCAGRVFVTLDLLSDECAYSLLHIVRERLQWHFIAGS